MADRTDIDALLISALYGELTPADEARLTAHLESHPADRTALADLTQTRAAIRESRLLAVQHDPPASVSTMLIREAARRAPRPERETAGWFQRFLHSFMAHPAMAAAAMLVLVVGVAGTVYVRRGDTLYQASAPAAAPPEATESVARAPEPTGSAPAAAEPTGAAPAPAEVAAAAPAAHIVPDPRAKNDAQAGAGSGYAVRLDEAEKGLGKLKVATDDGAAGRYKGGKDSVSGGAFQDALRGSSEGRFASPAKAPSKKLANGVELRSPKLEPKDLDDDKPAVARGPAGDLDSERSRAVTDARAQAPGGGAADAAPVTLPPASPSEPPALAKKSAPSTGNAKSVAKPMAPSVAQGKAPPPPPAASAPRDNRGPSDGDTITADAKREAKAGEKPSGRASDKADVADDAADASTKLLDWARKQHREVIALVGANKCREAASAAAAIYSRAPDYYASSVATDRSVKPCLPYLNNMRENEDRSRAAAKRATATDTQAPSPPVKK